MTEQEARERIGQLVQYDVEPTLDVAEMDTLVALSRLPDPTGNSPLNTADAGSWTEGEVLPGTVVVDAHGRYWRARIGGTTGTTEPTWPILAGWNAPNGFGWPSVVGNAAEPLRYSWDVLDGTVIWEDNGSAWAPTFDLNRAARHGWLIKAGKAASRFDFEEDGQRFSRSQIIAHCRAMAAEYDRPTLRSTRVSAC